MSRCLAERSIDHVVLERGEVANSWKTERWDSLRLLTPNWQSRLPGFGYEGDDPDGYRTMPETIAFIERYADDAISAPDPDPHHGDVGTREQRRLPRSSPNQGDWHCPTVVLATGACNIPHVPKRSRRLVPPGIRMLTPDRVPQPGSARGRRCAGGGRRVHRHSDRRQRSSARAGP